MPSLLALGWVSKRPLRSHPPGLGIRWPLRSEGASGLGLHQDSVSRFWGRSLTVPPLPPPLLSFPTDRITLGGRVWLSPGWALHGCGGPARKPLGGL